MEDEILRLSDMRYIYITKYEKSFNDETYTYDIDEPKEIDELSKKILSLIKENHVELSFEFIIEELTKLGDAPSLLYDDNGHFSISSDGIQNTPMDDNKNDFSILHVIKKERWFNSIREALNDYLSNF